MTRVLVVGGGLAGLSAAARLAHGGCQVTLLEKAPKLGGRAITIPLKGFNFNFGAHAIYGRDRSALHRLEQELGLRVDWQPFSPRRAFYDLGTFTTPVAATLEGLLRTRMLDPQHKVRFAYEVMRTLARVDQGEPGVPIGEYLAGTDDQLRRLLLTIACHNFFTAEPERIPSPLFFQYYRRLFTTMWPVSYIGGGWQSIVDGLERVLTESGGRVVSKERAQAVAMDGERVVSVRGKEGGDYDADAFVFCVPPDELLGLFGETVFSALFQEYAKQAPNEVVVYDVGLSRRIPSPYTYLYQVAERVFITDISSYDRSCTPPGGQLMQAVAYTNAGEAAQGGADAKVELLEGVYDKHFDGWRDVLVARRISKRATVQEIKCIDDQRLMPVKFYGLANAYFAGDWCQGEGQLSELSFSSAYEVSERILGRRPGRLAVAVVA